MSYKISSQLVRIDRISSGGAEVYIIIVTVVKFGLRSSRRGQGNSHRTPCTKQINQLIPADIFLQLMFINKGKKLLWSAVDELSDEIHTQASFPVT